MIRFFELRCSRLGLMACLVLASCASPSARVSRKDADAWLVRSLVAKEAALSQAYNTCNLHALRASLFAGTSIEKPGGQRIDPVIEARDRICGRLYRHVKSGSMAVRAVGDDSALVTGTQRFCAIDTSPCMGGLRFIHLWTLYGGIWRMSRMYRFTARL